MVYVHTYNLNKKGIEIQQLQILLQPISLFLAAVMGQPSVLKSESGWVATSTGSRSPL